MTSTPVRVVRCAVWPLAFFLMAEDLWEIAPDDILFLCIVVALGIWGSVTPHSWIRIGAATVLLGILFGGGCVYEPIARSIISHTGTFSEGVRAMLDALKPFRPYTLLAAAGLFSMAVSQTHSPTTEKPKAVEAT